MCVCELSTSAAVYIRRQTAIWFTQAFIMVVHSRTLLIHIATHTHTHIFSANKWHM